MSYPRTVAFRAHRRLMELLSLGALAHRTYRPFTPPAIVAKTRTERVAIVRTADGSVFGYADIPVELLEGQ